jgi:hypothetical protein
MRVAKSGGAQAIALVDAAPDRAARSLNRQPLASVNPGQRLSMNFRFAREARFGRTAGAGGERAHKPGL